MKAKVSWVLACVVGISTLGGCKKLAALATEKARSAASSAAATAAKESPKPTTEDELDGKTGSKLANYIECFNRTSRDVFEAKSTYYERVDEQKGPGPKAPRGTPYMNELSSSDRCLESLDKGKKAEPALPDIDSLADAYRAEVVKMAVLMKATHNYYSQGDYKDDQYKKGKELHAGLKTGFADFKKVHEPFDAKVIAMNDAINQRRLVRLSKDPKAKLEYLIENSVAAAKKVVKLVDVNSIKQLDEAAYTAAFTAYETAYNELQTYVGAHAEEAGKVTMLSSYTSSGSEFLTATKELKRRKRDNKDFNKEGGSPEQIDGHPAQVIKKYNDLVDKVNMLSYR